VRGAWAPFLRGFGEGEAKGGGEGQALYPGRKRRPQKIFSRKKRGEVVLGVLGWGTLRMNLGGKKDLNRGSHPPTWTHERGNLRSPEGGGGGKHSPWPLGGREKKGWVDNFADFTEAKEVKSGKPSGKRICLRIRDCEQRREKREGGTSL